MQLPWLSPPQVPLMAWRPKMTPTAINKNTRAMAANVIRNIVMEKSSVDPGL
jgi:hypothetical protein